MAGRGDLEAEAGKVRVPEINILVSGKSSVCRSFRQFSHDALTPVSTQ